MWGKQYLENVCMYAALFRLYCGIITQTAHCRARRRHRKGSIPLLFNPLGSTTHFLRTFLPLETASAKKSTYFSDRNFPLCLMHKLPFKFLLKTEETGKMGEMGGNGGKWGEMGGNGGEWGNE